MTASSDQRSYTRVHIHSCAGRLRTHSERTSEEKRRVNAGHGDDDTADDDDDDDDG